MQEHGGLRKDEINELNIGSNYEKFGRNLGRIWKKPRMGVVIKKYMYEDSDENEIL